MKRAARGIWLTGAALLAVYPIGALALWAAGYKMEMRFPQFYLGAAAFLLVLGAVLTRMESQTRLCKAAAILCRCGDTGRAVCRPDDVVFEFWSYGSFENACVAVRNV